MKNIRIRTYILISMVLIVTLSLGAVVYATVSLFSSRRISSVKDSMNDSVTDLSHIVEDVGMKETEFHTGFINRTQSLARFQNGVIVAVDRDYRIVCDTAGNHTGSYIINKDIMDVMNGREKKLEFENNKEVTTFTPVYFGGNVDGVIIFSVSLSKVRSEIDDVRNVLMVMLGVLLLIDVLLIIYISKRSVRDLNNVNEQIMHTALGNLSEKLPENEGFIEIQVLSENYNDVMSKLAMIDQTRNEFVSNVSHELKTPITSMKVLAESLTQNESATAEEYKEFMTDIVDEIDRETKIINDLLTLVRTDSSNKELNMEKADINEMMKTIIKTVSPLAKQRGIDMKYECYREVVADVDQVKLSLAISNLIENAVKYNVDNGWIKCSLNTDHKYFYIKVADSGVGIPDDAKDRVFDRFYRVDKARSRDTGGTGLGLSITRSIINAHKGTIKLYSESGKGTTFTVKIPLENNLKTNQVGN